MESPLRRSDCQFAFRIARSGVEGCACIEAEGYHIEAVPNQGYTLCTDNDLLSTQGILPYLTPPLKSREIRVFPCLPSTNQEAKRMALESAEQGSAVLAEEQSAGRGRLGRSFFSPRGNGLYMSVILRPKADVSNAVLITTAAAVGVCRAIDTVTGRHPQIKWVNDLYLNEKKICGILTEAVTNFETGVIESVVVGIGINFKGSQSTLPKSCGIRPGFSTQMSRLPPPATIWRQRLSISFASYAIRWSCAVSFRNTACDP